MGLAALGSMGLGCTHALPLPSLLDAHRADAERAGRLVSAAQDLHHALLSPIRVELADGLDPQEAAALALVGNWELAAARDAHGEARAALGEAREMPNPDFNRGFENPRGSGSEGLQATRALDFTLSLRPWVTRSARVAAERENLRSVDLGIAWQEWQVAQSARMQTVRLGWLRRRLETLHEDLQVRTDLAELLERAVARGDFKRTELELQRGALLAQRSHERELLRTQTELQSGLRQLIGFGSDEALVVSRPELPSVPLRDGAAPTLIDDCFARRLDLEALRAGYAAQESKLRQSVLEQLPNLSVGFTNNRDESGLKFLGGFVDLDLPALHHNQSAVAAAQATRARLHDEYEGRMRAAEAEIRLLTDTLALLDHQIEEASSELARLRALEQRETDALARGDVGRLEFEAVRAGRLDLQLEMESLSQARDEALVGRDTSCGGAALVPPAREVDR